MYLKIHIVVLSAIIVLVYGIVIQNKTSSKHYTSVHQHNAKKASPHYRQASQKCDLICPGAPPIAMPPNFIHNCSSVANTTPNTVTATSPKPSRITTTTDSGDDSSETDESTEESVESTSKTAKSTKKNGNMRHLKITNINVKKKSQTKHQHRQNKKHIRKEKLLLDRQVRNGILKYNKHFNGRSSLDGCRIVCAEGTESNRPENSGNQGYVPEGTATDGSVPGESDYDDPYVPGEDTAIEIIYIPGQIKSNQRPMELYQTNNYALLEPQPAFEYSYDPFFIEGKQNKVKKIKVKSRKKEIKLQKNNK